MLYDPGPEPVSEASPPILLFHLDRVNTKLSEKGTCLTLLASNSHTALENKPAATRYKKHVEMMRKIWIEAIFPPLLILSARALV